MTHKEDGYNLANTSTRRRHEVRDENGHLVAVIDLVADDRYFWERAAISN
jgi:hypothetical protein